MNNKSVSQIIEERHSVRGYEEREISGEILLQLGQYVEKVVEEYEGRIRIQILQKGESSEKLGTYGVITGTKYFFGGVCKKDLDSYTMLGYALEKIVLYCTGLGLGTVWLGGTFQKGNFAKAMKLQENETFLVVVPFGYEGGKKSLFAKLVGNNSKKREEFSKNFYEDNVQTPLVREHAGRYEEPLEMLRFAPSAVNKQPWRVIKEGNCFHFYVVNSKMLNRLDLGIALCHFHLSVIEKGLHGEFVRENPEIKCEFDYVVSWKYEEI